MVETGSKNGEMLIEEGFDDGSDGCGSPCDGGEDADSG